MESTAGGAGARPEQLLLLPVQELVALGAAARDVPARYVARAHEPPATVAPGAIPIIDLDRLCQPDPDGAAAAADEAAKLRLALACWGIFLVENHGVDSSLTSSMMDASREFFRQPLEEKRKCTNQQEHGDGKSFRLTQLEGYGGDRVRSADQVLDWSDRLSLKLVPEQDRILALWPQHPDSFRAVLHEFAARCTSGVKDRLLLAMARLLELDDDGYFSERMGDRAGTYARFSYYPPCPRPDLVYGLKPHSDGSFVTILMVDDSVGGLQVLRDGAWYDVPIRPGALVCNVGDQLEIMSNGMFKSPVHRVVTNAEKERLSISLFYSVDVEKDIEPASKLIDERRPALYKKMKMKDYFAGQYEYFSQGKRFIDDVKIRT